MAEKPRRLPLMYYSHLRALLHGLVAYGSTHVDNDIAGRRITYQELTGKGTDSLHHEEAGEAIVRAA
jgi:hypothetical protein